MSEKWKIPSYMAKTENLAEDALNVAGFFLAGQAKRLTPTISARLKNSISSAVKGKRRQGLNDATPGMASKRGVAKDLEDKARESEGVPKPNERLVAWVGTSVSYAPHVEFGTSNQQQQSFLRRAFRENKKQIMKFLAGRMKK